MKLTDKFFNYFEVAGGKDIRDVFKKVKIPTPLKMEGQKTLGGLEIVDAKKDESHKTMEGKKLDGMEVVDVAQKQEPAIIEKNEEEDGENDSENSQPEEHDGGFLDDLDARIAKLRARNDDNDKDEMLKRKPLPGMESTEQTENISPENENSENKE